MQALPHPGRLPLAHAAPAGDPAAVAQLGWQALPGEAGLQHKDDPAEGSAVRDPRTTALRLRGSAWQERFDRFP